MEKKYEDMSIAELLEIYNKEAPSRGASTLKAFKDSKQKLITRLEGLLECSPIPKRTPKPITAEPKKLAKAAQKIVSAAKVGMISKAGVTAPSISGVKKQSIGAFCRRMIEAGADNKHILMAVLAEFPKAKTSVNCINWYRNDVKARAKNA